MPIDPAAFNRLTQKIIGAAIEVHRSLGPGLLESTYTQCLHIELTARKLRFEAQRSVPITYKGVTVDGCYRVDLVVEDLIVVEVKSTLGILPVFESQVLTYLRLTGCPIGLLINFNVPKLIDGLKRKLNPRAHIPPGQSAPQWKQENL